MILHPSKRAQAAGLLFTRHPDLPDGISFNGMIEALGGWITDGIVHNLPEYDELLEAVDEECPDDAGSLV